MSKFMIAPSILSADFSRIGEEVEELEKCGADMIHCDVMDGMFVPNITFGSKMVADIRKHTKLPLDVHLMIVDPERYVEDFIKAGADYITVHYEATERLEETLQFIKNNDRKCGVVINPQTKPEEIENVIPLCDMVLVMGVQPGFGGQFFIEGTTDKISHTRELINKYNKKILLEVDGGISLRNIEAVKDAGANVIVAGNTIFSAENKADTINKLRKL